MNVPDRTDLETRAGLPDALRVLLEQYPREIWESHRNFDGHTRFWLQRHLMFRDVVGRLQAESESYLDGKAELRGYVQRSARLAGFVLNELHAHHHIEDVHYFPLLSGLEPRLEHGFEMLDHDHHALHRHLHDLATRAQALIDVMQAGTGAQAAAGARPAAGALHAQLGDLERFLDRHLTDEEDLIVPVILHHAPRM